MLRIAQHDIKMVAIATESPCEREERAGGV